MILGHSCILPEIVRLENNTTYISTVEYGSFSRTNPTLINMQIMNGFFNRDWRLNPENILHFDPEIGRLPTFGEPTAINVNHPGEEVYDAYYVPLADFVEETKYVCLKSGIYEKQRKTKTHTIIIPIPEGKTINEVNINKSQIHKIYEGSVYPTPSQVINGLNANLLKNGLPRLNSDADTCTIRYFKNFIKSIKFKLSDCLKMLRQYAGTNPIVFYDPLCKTDCNRVNKLDDYFIENTELRKKRNAMETRMAEKHLPSDLLAELDKGGMKKSRRRRKQRIQKKQGRKSRRDNRQ